MESSASNKKNVNYLLCVIDVFTKYAWIKPLENKKVKTVVNEYNSNPIK